MRQAQHSPQGPDRSQSRYALSVKADTDSQFEFQEDEDEEDHYQRERSLAGFDIMDHSGGDCYIQDKKISVIKETKKHPEFFQES